MRKQTVRARVELGNLAAGGEYRCFALVQRTIVPDGQGVCSPDWVTSEPLTGPGPPGPRYRRRRARLSGRRGRHLERS